MSIHPLAVVSPHARLGKNVTVEPLAIIEDGAEIGDHCTIASHAVIKSGTILGNHNHVAEGAVLGGLAQHTNLPERVGTLHVGDHNTFRENATAHRALEEGHATVIGNHNLVMVGAHIGHDCHVGNNVILVNNILLGGHVTVEDRAFVSGAVAVHQFCRIGKLAMVGGLARVVQDVPPYVTIDGSSGLVVGLNLVGLRRAGFDRDQIRALKDAYRLVYRQGLARDDFLAELRHRYPTGVAARFHEFLSIGKRGFVQERRLPPGATIKLRRSDELAGETRRKAG